MAKTGFPVSGPTKTYVSDGVGTLGCAAVASGATAGHIVQASAANAQILGVLDVNTIAGQPTRVTRLGDTPAIAGAAIAVGQYVKTDANGHFVPVTGTPGGGENICGRAESVAVSPLDIFTLFVLPSVL